MGHPIFEAMKMSEVYRYTWIQEVLLRCLPWFGEHHVYLYIYMCVCVHVYVYHVLPRWLDFFGGRNYHQLTQDRCRVVGVFFPAAVGLVCG